MTLCLAHGPPHAMLTSPLDSPVTPAGRDETTAAYLAWTAVRAELAAAHLRRTSLPSAEAEAEVAELVPREAEAAARVLAARPTTLAGALLLFAFVHKRRRAGGAEVKLLDAAGPA